MNFFSMSKSIPIYYNGLFKWVGVTLGGAKSSDGSDAGLVGIADMPDREIIDVNANGSTYYGTAPWGSATSDAAWVIERETSNGWVTSAPNQVWDDHLTVIYNNGVA